MTSVMMDILIPYIEITLVIKCKDYECELEFNDVNYTFGDGGYVNYDFMSTMILNLCKQEMRVIIDNGGKFSVNTAFISRKEQLDNTLNDLPSIVNNESAKKRDRKRAKMSYDNKKSESGVYHSVDFGASNTIFEIKQSIRSLLQ